LSLDGSLGADPSAQVTKDIKNLAAQIMALLLKGPASRDHISSFFNINRRRASTVLSILKVLPLPYARTVVFVGSHLTTCGH
jgi:hypothetical protein